MILFHSATNSRHVLPSSLAKYPSLDSLSSITTSPPSRRQVWETALLIKIKITSVDTSIYMEWNRKFCSFFISLQKFHQPPLFGKKRLMSFWLCASLYSEYLCKPFPHRSIVRPCDVMKSCFMRIQAHMHQYFRRCDIIRWRRLCVIYTSAVAIACVNLKLGLKLKSH